MIIENRKVARSTAERTINIVPLSQRCLNPRVKYAITPFKSPSPRKKKSNSLRSRNQMECGLHLISRKRDFIKWLRIKLGFNHHLRYISLRGCGLRNILNRTTSVNHEDGANTYYKLIDRVRDK